MSKSKYDEYVDKKVIVVRNAAGEEQASEVEGTVQAVNEAGILIKPKGSVKLDLIETTDIVEVRYVVDKPKPLAARVLKDVTFGQARNHLLERHGFTLAQVNGMDEQQALDEHKKIDHEKSGLGHVHGEKPKPGADKAADES